MRLFLSLLAAVALVPAGGVVFSPARADTPQMYALVDGARAANGLPPLRRSVPLQAVAQAWAEQMAATQTLSHNPVYDRQIPAGWTSAGENVGYAGGDQQLHDALMASPGHRDNILGRYTDIGIGRAVDSRGLVWEAQEFGAYAVSPGALVQPPQPPAAPVPPVAEPDPPRLPAVGSALGSEQALHAGFQLVSPGGTMHLALQSDGNLVSYSGGRPVWDTGTWGEPVKADRLVLHASGQLMLYAGDRALWWSSTSGQGPSRLLVQDDGNVVLYRTSDGAVTWSARYGLARSVLGTDQKVAS
ncbi:MAG: hypothetical protein JWQ37_3516, partial [Blastococcus sp.]|nr:hypothetical protein [Blastococcus sp.]